MAVLFPVDRAEPPWSSAARVCFYCDAELGAVAVTWHGPQDGIQLHPKCARSLGSHLIGDAREAELAVGAPHWLRRGRRLVRHQLLCQEGVA